MFHIFIDQSQYRILCWPLPTTSKQSWAEWFLPVGFLCFVFWLFVSSKKKFSPCAQCQIFLFCSIVPLLLFIFLIVVLPISSMFMVFLFFLCVDVCMFWTLSILLSNFLYGFLYGFFYIFFSFASFIYQILSYIDNLLFCFFSLVWFGWSFVSSSSTTSIE